MTKRRLWGILFCVGLPALLGLAVLLRSSPALYRVTILPSLGGQFTLPYAINDHGQVAGYSKVGHGSYHLFLWDRVRGMQDLGPVSNSTVDINSKGQIAGTMTDPNGNRQAFLWDPVGGTRLLGTMGGISSQVHAINDLGQVVGAFEVSPKVHRAFAWDAVHGMWDLGPQRAWAINNVGQAIVFTKAGPMIWDVRLAAVAKGHQVPIRGLLRINNSGWVAGIVQPPGGKWGKFGVVTWHPNSGVRTLAQMDEQCCNGAINDANQVLITSVQPPMKLLGRLVIPERAKSYIHDPQRGLVPLHHYVPAGRENFWAMDLNNRGCIVGAIQSRDYRQSKGVLLEPIPKRWKKRETIAGRQP